MSGVRLIQSQLRRQVPKEETENLGVLGVEEPKRGTR